MNSDRFQRVMQAFEEVAPLPADARARVLEDRLADAPDIRAEVEDLLRHHDGAGSPVATAAGLEAVGRPASWADIDRDGGPAPVLKGDYRILRTIGEGGMGVVFEAEQAFPRRRVALKAVRPGMASRGMLRRFRNEVQLLARLQHPGIAQIYEAGLADEHAVDQAFFAMELIDGQHITRYAEALKLDRRARWELMRKVCDAVQHAHQRGVIHRDLKPANILVAADGQPKVVDFGVARAAEPGTEDASVATRAGQLIGTPSYMSPEQMRGEVVDTRSDIYALGVIAYQLLSGRLPFDLNDTPIGEAARIIREDDPPTLGSVIRELRGDAEIIVAKAMAKEPERRYLSAGDMADDIARFLAGEPIAARRDSAAYMLRKQLRRYRTAAVAGLVAILGLLIFASYAVVAGNKQRELALAAQAASEEAVRARDAALAAKAAADAATERALAELKQAAIERGRLEAIADNVPLAEELLWTAHFDNPDSTSARWGLWELYNRHPTLWTRVGPGRPSRAAASPRGGWIAFGLGGGRVDLIDGRTGQVRGSLRNLGENAAAMAFSGEGDRLAIGFNSGQVVLVDVASRQQETRLDAGLTGAAAAVRSLAWSPDGAILATSHGDGQIRLWDADLGRLIRQWAPFAQPTFAMAFSPDGSQLAAAGETVNNPGSIAVFSMADGARVHEFTNLHDAQVQTLAFSADGRVLFTGGREGVAMATSLDDGGRARIAVPNAGAVQIITVSPTGRLVLIAGGEQATIFEAGAAPRQVRKLARQRFAYHTATWLSDDELTISTSDGLIRRVMTAPEPAATWFTGYTSWCFSTTYSPDGRMLAIGTAAGVVDIFDAATHQRLAVCDTGDKRLRIRGMKFLADSRTLLTGAMDGQARGFDAADGRLLFTLEAPRQEIYALAVDPAEKLVATGHIDGTCRVFDLASRSLVFELPRFEKRLEGLTFSPDGRHLVLSSLNRGVVIYDIASRAEVTRLTCSAMPWAVLYSPDGSTLYVSTQEGTVDLFDMPAGIRRATLQGHRRLVPGLALTRDGSLLASSGEEGIIKLWDTRNLVNVLTLDPQSSTVVSVAFSPAGDRLAAAAAGRLSIEYDFTIGQRSIDGNTNYQRDRLRPGR